MEALRLPGMDYILRSPFRAAPSASGWQTGRNDAGSGPIVKKFAAAMALTLAAAAGAGSAAAQPALAGGVPAAPGVTGVSALGAAARAPLPVRASALGESGAPVVPGARLWVRRYNGPGNSMGNDDVARSVAVSPDGSAVYVTGYSQGTISDEYATIAYSTYGCVPVRPPPVDQATSAGGDHIWERTALRWLVWQ